MNAITPQNRIKPLPTHTVHIKSLLTYRTYLLRRPKQTITFKFTRQKSSSGANRADQTKSEFKLQKALSLFKSVRKVDLSQFQVDAEYLNRNRLRSFFKRISKISSLQWTRCNLENELDGNLAEKCFKYLPRLHSLTYELKNSGFTFPFQTQDDPDDLSDPLSHLKYHQSTLKSLTIGSSGRGFDFSRVFSAGLKKYPSSLEHLTVTSVLPRDFNLHLERFLKLKSVSLEFSDHEGLILDNLGALAILPKLSSLNFNFKGNNIAILSLVLNSLADQEVLKKLRLVFSSSLYINIETLKAIQKMSYLTHFDFQVHISDANTQEILEIIADCLENMKQLEALRLKIHKQSLFESFNPLKMIYQKINCLEFLKHLDINFTPLGPLAKIPICFLHFQDLFKKPIKLQTLNLNCVQLDPTQALLELANVLQNTSNSLNNLNVYFGYCSPDSKSQKLIIEFLKILCNIQVLELSGLHFDRPHFFGNIIEAVCSLKYLREFVLGNIKDTVSLLEYRTALEMIITKRGLRKFRCSTSEALLRKCGFEEDKLWRWHSLLIDMKKVEVKNPFLENIYFRAAFGHFDVLQEFSEEI